MEVNEVQEALGHPLSFSAQETRALMEVGEIYQKQGGRGHPDPNPKKVGERGVIPGHRGWRQLWRETPSSSKLWGRVSSPGGWGVHPSIFQFCPMLSISWDHSKHFKKIETGKINISHRNRHNDNVLLFKKIWNAQKSLYLLRNSKAHQTV